MSKAGEMAPFIHTGYGYPSASQLLVSSEHTNSGVTINETLKNEHSPLSTALMQHSPIASESVGSQIQPSTPGSNSHSSNNATSSIGQNGSVSPFGCHQIGAPSTTPCCDNGRIILADPVSGKTVCTCQYDSVRITLSDYSRLQPVVANMGIYAPPYSTSDQRAYSSLSVDGSAFYPALHNPYPLKDNNSSSDTNAWTTPAGLQSTTGFFSYDTPMGAYGYGASYDLAARRKNATRESTATLKTWLNEHKKNPYPTKGEKIMLAIITKMTLTQVSTWFANARRRLKKENKMTWEPKNRADDDDDANASDEEKYREEHESASRRTEVGRIDVPSGLEEVGVVGEQPKGYLSNSTCGYSKNFPNSYTSNMQKHWDMEMQQRNQTNQLDYEIVQIKPDLDVSSDKIMPKIRSLSGKELSEENLRPCKLQHASEQHRQDYDLAQQQNQTSLVATLSIQAKKSESDHHTLRTVPYPKQFSGHAVQPQSTYGTSFT